MIGIGPSGRVESRPLKTVVKSVRPSESVRMDAAVELRPLKTGVKSARVNSVSLERTEIVTMATEILLP